MRFYTFKTVLICDMLICFWNGQANSKPRRGFEMAIRFIMALKWQVILSRGFKKSSNISSFCFGGNVGLHPVLFKTILFLGKKVLSFLDLAFLDVTFFKENAKHYWVLKVSKIGLEAQKKNIYVPKFDWQGIYGSLNKALSMIASMN